MSVEQKLIDALALENAALKAQVELLRNTLKTICRWDSLSIKFVVNNGSNGERNYYRNLASDALEKTTQQCLNDVKGTNK